MHRRLVVVVVGSAGLLGLGQGVQAQTAPAPCAAADLGCQVTQGLVGLGTSLGVTPTTAPATTATTAPAKANAVVRSAPVGSSSTAAVAASVGADASLSGTAVPSVPVGTELVLPPLDAPDFGPAPVVAAVPLPVPARSTPVRPPTAPARPAAPAGSSRSTDALAAAVALVSLLGVGSALLRRVAGGQLGAVTSTRWRSSPSSTVPANSLAASARHSSSWPGAIPGT